MTQKAESKTLLYKILPEHELIIDCWFGELTFEKILASKLEQTKDKNWNKAFDNISDIRNAHFTMKEDEAKKIIEYIKVDRRWLSERKTAHLTKKPNQVVFQTFLEMNKSKEIPNAIERFSTLNAVLKWLNIDKKDWVNIQNIMAELSDEALQ